MTTAFMRLVNRVSELESELRATQAERDRYRQTLEELQRHGGPAAAVARQVLQTKTRGAA